MKHGFKLLIGSAVLGSLSLGISEPVLAANECKIQYGYFTGSGFSREDNTQTVFINTGDTSNINQSNLNFVKNLKTPRVKFFLTGPGVNDVTLDKDMVNPLAITGFYLTPTTLVKAECLNTSSNNQPQTPAILVNTMKAAGATVDAIAMALKNTFNLGKTQIAQALKVAGYAVGQVAGAIKSVFNATATQVAQALKAAGYAVGQIAGAIKSAFNATASQVAEALKAAGYAAGQVASAIKSAFNATAAQVAQALKAAGYAVGQIAAGIKSAFNATAAQVAQALKAAGYAAGQVAAGIKSAFNATAAQVAQALKAAGYAVGQVAAGIKSAFNATASQVAEALKAAGYTAGQAAGAIKSAFNATAAQLAQALKAAGYTLDEIAKVMKQLSNLTREQAEKALKAAGYTLSQIKTALDSLYGQVVTTTGKVLAGAMKISNFFHGQYPYSLVSKQCYWPTGPVLYGVSNPIPLPNNNRPTVVTITGNNLLTASTISGLPAGSSVRITGRGNCGIQLEVRVPRTAALNARGTAYIMAGTQRGPGFSYIVGPVPSRQAGFPTARIPNSTAPARGNTSSSNPDLIPFQAQNNLYKVGTATTEDVEGDIYTGLLPFDGSAFCQTVPQGSTARNNMPTANRETITVANVQWGVKNNSNEAVSSAFTIELVRGAGSNVVATQTINSLGANQVRSFNYIRPNSQTCVARVGVGVGCFHCGQRTEGWNDNLGYRVRVDSGKTITESNEGNNERNL